MRLCCGNQQHTPYILIKNTMNTEILKLKCPDNYSLEMTCHIHGWINLSPFEWHTGDQSLSLSCYAHDKPVDLRFWQTQDYIQTRVESNSPLSPYETEQVITLTKRCLGLEVSTEGLLEIAAKIGF